MYVCTFHIYSKLLLACLLTYLLNYVVISTIQQWGCYNYNRDNWQRSCSNLKNRQWRKIHN